MNRRAEILVMLGIDVIALNLAFYIFYMLRIRSGLVGYAIEPELWLPMAALCAFWIVWFFFFGLYTFTRISSRLQEITAILRATGVGVLFLFFLIFIDDQEVGGQTNSRAIILGYMAMLVLTMSSGRLVLRYIQRRLLRSGIGRSNTLIVGWSEKAFRLCDMILKFPILGYHIVGFVRPESQKEAGRGRKKEYKSFSIVGGITELAELIKRHNVSEILIGLDSTQHDRIAEVLRLCDSPGVSVKIVPDLYDIVSGQARINSLYGFPLMDVRPQLLKPWEAIAKRVLDVTVSFFVLLIGAPVWLLLGAIVKIGSTGPMLYRQDRVGKNGKPFKIMKFRSMRRDAEKGSGPVWAGKDDPRVTPVGRFMRKTHLDEIPQFWNVMVGDMSLVGPRPERPFFVEKLSKEIPLYKHRHRVRPGITGWAQVKHKYDETIEDVRAKVRYDLFYIENMSWRLDLSILVNTIYVMVTGKGRA